MNKEEIELKYQEFCRTPSDINYHLPKLREYADKCETVTEFGVRGCVSTFAFLASNCNKLTSYDIFDVAVPTVDKFTFICADDLKIEIEETDFLFIDSLHTYAQLKQELALHGNRANKFIGFHDTFIFGQNSEDGTTPGLIQAINEFMESNQDWTIDYRTDKNNGLTILVRK